MSIARIANTLASAVAIYPDNPQPDVVVSLAHLPLYRPINALPTEYLLVDPLVPVNAPTAAATATTAGAPTSIALPSPALDRGGSALSTPALNSPAAFPPVEGMSAPRSIAMSAVDNSSASNSGSPHIASGFPAEQQHHRQQTGTPSRAQRSSVTPSVAGGGYYGSDAGMSDEEDASMSPPATGQKRAGDSLRQDAKPAKRAKKKPTNDSSGLLPSKRRPTSPQSLTLPHAFAAASSPAPELTVRNKTGVGPYGYQIQATTCLSKKVEGHTRCFQCIARAIGHGCCFQGLRSFGVDNRGRVVDAGAFRNSEEVDDAPDYVTKDDWPTTGVAAVPTLKDSVAAAILPMLERELNHANSEKTVKARLDLSQARLCDTCMFTSVSGDWICETCGRTSCFICREALINIEEEEARDLATGTTKYYNNFASQTVEQQRRRKCIAKKRGTKGAAGENHTSSQFVPLTRSDIPDLEATLTEVKAWIASRPAPAHVPPPATPEQELQIKAWRARHPKLAAERNGLVIPFTELTEEIFTLLWNPNDTQPLVISGAPIEDIKKFDPAFFKKYYPFERVTLLNHKNLEAIPTNAEYFFNPFGAEKRDVRTWKIKVRRGTFLRVHSRKCSELTISFFVFAGLPCDGAAQGPRPSRLCESPSSVAIVAHSC